ncbi:FAD-dependent oxidoreductase [Pseudoclavibacter sp. RFBB5]|uniref:FAD-dependent oxidoreductase n=1 Tax=Pseudoclavibacter sp. RFBB5 TaxID=2080574 RepID=UPI000CE8A67D|nr:FAD-dependent oxidoreductase [Pseudoclavibacter sp. RFBB5]PPG27204.1 flavoprotein [Pseudoclavibacter sp. RFBB5]
MSTSSSLTPASTTGLDALPVAIIGAGPIGLAAAAQLLERGQEVVVFEAGDQAGASVAAWGHTRLFSPWEYLVDEAAARLLDEADWNAPPAKTLPTGQQLVDDYLLPLATAPALADGIRYGHRVLAVTRRGMDRTRTRGRERAPFVLRTESAAGVTETLARAVIDASGTYETSNAIGSSGLEPIGADQVREHLSHALPDVLGRDRAQFAGKRVLVVGAGHSAANTLLKLASLAKREPATQIFWAIRGVQPARVYGSANDELAARGELGGATRALVTSGQVQLLDQFEIDALAPAEDGGVRVTGLRAGVAASVDVDVIVNATGFRPNLDLLRELRLDLDTVVEAPRALAPLIDPNAHSCGTVYPHGVDELTHPEPGFYIAGMKSYGRAPTFLLLTGYEQVRSIADELAGHHEQARLVTLVLPETGVCSTGTPEESDGVSCGVPEPINAGRQAAAVSASGCCA